VGDGKLIIISMIVSGIAQLSNIIQ